MSGAKGAELATKPRYPEKGAAFKRFRVYSRVYLLKFGTSQSQWSSLDIGGSRRSIPSRTNGAQRAKATLGTKAYIGFIEVRLGVYLGRSFHLKVLAVWLEGRADFGSFKLSFSELRLYIPCPKP